MRHARAFNLSREELRAEIVEPWLEQRPIELGDRQWEPKASSLQVLEGPRLEPPDLSFGQGWSNARRASDNVTRRVLSEVPAPRQPRGFLVETESPEQLAKQIAARHGGRAIEWREAQQRLNGREGEIAAIVLVKPNAG